MISRTSDRPAVNPRATAATWHRAYAASPQLASHFAWNHVCKVLEDHPGEWVYEAGFGSGMNLLWARQHGWKVAGCDVAPQAVDLARQLLPGADLRHESILDCSAPSDAFDVVVDRAALSYLTPKETEKAFGHIRRILKTGGVFLFNPYGVQQSIPPLAGAPEPYLWDLVGVRRLFKDTKWEVLDVEATKMQLVEYEGPVAPIEHTLRIVARKIA